MHKEEELFERLSINTTTGVINNPFGKNSEIRARGGGNTDPPISNCQLRGLALQKQGLDISGDLAGYVLARFGIPTLRSAAEISG